MAANTEMVKLDLIPNDTKEALLALAGNASAIGALTENAEALNSLAENAEALLALLETEPSTEGGEPEE